MASINMTTLPVVLDTGSTLSNDSSNSQNLNSASQAYRDSIRAYTTTQDICNSLFPGNDLSRFELLLRQGTERIPTQLAADDFVTLYRFSSQGDREVKPLRSVSELHDNFNDVQSAPSASQGTNESTMLFLRGFPAPDWIAAIGAKFQVDPCFFSGHMALPSALNDRHLTFSRPLLPSTASNFLRLRYVSIGMRPTEDKVGQEDMNKSRRDAENKMKKYHDNLGIPKHRKAGDAIVRLYHLHNEQYFSVEQDITICKLHTAWGWLSLVCIDSGNDLSEGPEGPWRESRDYSRRSGFIPTIQHVPGIALNYHWRSMTIPKERHLKGNFNQSASLLVHNYGQSLDKALASVDPFYALNELYSFSAHSICQFLNLIDSIIMVETGYGFADDRKFSQLNLSYHQDILIEQARVLQDIIRDIESQGGSMTHSVMRQAQTPPVDIPRSRLLTDFQELLARTERLTQRCASGMNVVMNRAMIAESKRAISQARKIEQLTWLASFYIPLSFMTSFFAMDLGNIRKLPLWLWFATSIPVLLLSFVGVRLLRRYFSKPLDEAG
ncbi:hypothetical protein P153DRAFT_434684 [Dothidotthia symphoricarpi CBS 119687]|uniref:Cora-domain-containing protein n=1 Tax=Dothidotthia symphoricarpi CBS 119687 TaxID=1392245 RepID=A0A6A6A242_9PLEO|nr:uncharacterized protein P153DRAFT_434684 [Dothidotthia symphoricarpi CBS 119687]KAF2124977.1 hypothetical protein P153DRAFT_434684 [Dothidotthia symphoricarpi CBS 119687]